LLILGGLGGVISVGKDVALTKISAVIPGGQPSAPAIEFVSDALTSSPYTWTVNLAAGKLNQACQDEKY
jgi:hypothetical protein